MTALAPVLNDIDRDLDNGRPMHGYLIEGHGIYTWGRDMAETKRHLDAFEFLLQAELEILRLKGAMQ